MFNRITTMALGAVLGQVLKQRVRDGSIKAVKNYIQLVKLARMATLGLVGLSVAAAVLVAGILLVVVGIVGLLPIEPNTVAIILLSVGAVMTLAAGAGFAFAFSEKRWLEASKAYELMDVALGNWEGILPPNPLEMILKHPAAQAAKVKSQPLESRLMPLEVPLEVPLKVPLERSPESTPMLGKVKSVAKAKVDSAESRLDEKAQAVADLKIELPRPGREVREDNRREIVRDYRQGELAPV